MQESDLGFFYMMFQPDFTRGRLKAWLDGDPQWVYFSMDQFFEFVECTSLELVPTARRASRETSFFIWDVAARRISRLSIKMAQEPFKVLLEEMKRKEAAEASETRVDERYWKNDLDTSEAAPKIKV